MAEAPGKTMHNLWEATRNLDEEKKKMGKKLITSLLQLSRENRKNAKKQERDSEKSPSPKKIPIFLDRMKNQ